MSPRLLPALLLAIAPVPVVAQAPTVDPGAIASAREFLRVSDIQGQMKALGPALAQASSNQMKQMFGANVVPDGLQAEFAAATAEFMGSLGDAFTPAVQEEMAQVYARRFTKAELDRIVALTRDPVMTRLRTETPAITGELMPVMFAAMKPLQTAYVARIRQIVRDWIARHPDDRAKLRSPDAI